MLAQRLVRILCEDCKTFDESKSSYEIFKVSSSKIYYKSCGCKMCNYTGYKGRVAIGELFIISDEIKEYLKNDVDDNSLMKYAIDNGMITLNEQMTQLLESGTTSFDEALRIGI